MKKHWMAALLIGALGALGCGDDDGGTEPDAGGTDASAEDAGPPETIEDLPIEEERSLADLGAAVDAVRDERGMWHIYAESLEDAMRAQGYLQAVDRMGQMEFIRRQATGRIAEFGGSLDPSLIDSDADARFEGHARNAEAILPTLTDEERGLLDAYTAGVNAHIAELRSGDAQLPRGVGDILPADLITDWEPTDTLAIARLQAASLSYDAGSDIGRTERLAPPASRGSSVSPVDLWCSLMIVRV